MYGESKRVARLTVLVGLLMPCMLAVAVTAVAQGWGSGAGSSNKSPNAAGKSSAPSGNSAKSKSAKTSRTGNKTTSSKHEKGAARVAGTSSDSAANKGKRERRVNKPTAAAKSADSPANKPENKSTASAAKPLRTGRCDPEKEERTDLSGTYNGTVKYPAAGLDGEAILAITGNHFTLTSGSKTETGNITAVTTCSYTAVAMMFGEWKTPQLGDPVLPPLPMLSLRAIGKGDQFRLIASPSEKGVFSFDSGQKK
jgi:hypothetical protein